MIAHSFELPFKLVEVAQSLEDESDYLLRHVDVPINRIDLVLLRLLFQLSSLFFDFLSVTSNVLEELIEVEAPVSVVITAAEHCVNMVLLGLQSVLIKQDPDVFNTDVALAQTYFVEFSLQTDGRKLLQKINKPSSLLLKLQLTP